MLGTPALSLSAAVIVALAAQTAPPAPAATVTLGNAVARGGDGVHVTATVVTRNAVVLTVNGTKLKDYQQTTDDRRAFDVTLVAAAGRPLSARIGYQDCISTLTDPSQNDPRLLPTSGRSYVVAPAAESGVPKSSVRELGDQDEPLAAEARPDVALQVERDVAELLHGGLFAPLLANRPLAIGQPIDVPADVARRLLAGVLDDGSVTRFTLTPKPGGAGDAADRVAFAAALVVTKKQGGDLPNEATLLPLESTFELAGEIVVGRAGARLVALDLSGPIRFGGTKEGGGTRVEVTGTGTLTWTVRAEPLGPH